MPTLGRLEEAEDKRCRDEEAGGRPAGLCRLWPAPGTSSPHRRRRRSSVQGRDPSLKSPSPRPHRRRTPARRTRKPSIKTDPSTDPQQEEEKNKKDGDFDNEMRRHGTQKKKPWTERKRRGDGEGGLPQPPTRKTKPRKERKVGGEDGRFIVEKNCRWKERHTAYGLCQFSIIQIHSY